MILESAEIIGLFAGFLTAFSTLPQTLKIIRSKKSEDVSVGTLLMLNGSYVLWLIYGLTLNLFSVILWNVIALGFGLTVIILRLFVWSEDSKINTEESSL